MLATVVSWHRLHASLCARCWHCCRVLYDKSIMGAASSFEGVDAAAMGRHLDQEHSTRHLPRSGAPSYSPFRGSAEVVLAQRNRKHTSTMRRLQRAWGRTGTMLVELQATVEHKTGPHRHSQQRHWLVSVQAVHEDVRKELAAAFGTHARYVKRRVKEVRAVEHCNRQDGRSREACTIAVLWR